MRFKQFVENLEEAMKFNSGVEKLPPKKDFEKDLGPEMTRYFNKITKDKRTLNPNKDLSNLDFSNVPKSKQSASPEQLVGNTPTDATAMPTSTGSDFGDPNDPEHIMSNKPVLRTAGAPKGTGKVTRRDSFK